MIPAIYVHQTRYVRYADAIVGGYKPIETRTRNVLGRFVGQPVLIVRTQDGKPAEVIGQATISKAEYHTKKELDAMRNKTLIPPGSRFDCSGRGKWCYTMTDPMPMKPVRLDALDVEYKTRSYAMIKEA